MAASFPPSSSVIRFIPAAAERMTAWPVRVEPVNETFAIPGWDVTHGPLPVQDQPRGITHEERTKKKTTNRSSSPERTESTPGGRICWASSTNLSVASGVIGDGFTMTVFPASSAGEIYHSKVESPVILRAKGRDHGLTFHESMLIGKFHGT